MSWKLKKDLNSRKYILENEKGEIRVMKKDIKGIERGDYLQPIGRDKEAFAKKYGWLPNESKEDVKKYLKKQGMSDREISRLPRQGGTER